jgi:hypothetical protein
VPILILAKYSLSIHKPVGCITLHQTMVRDIAKKALDTYRIIRIIMYLLYLLPKIPCRSELVIRQVWFGHMDAAESETSRGLARNAPKVKANAHTLQ